MSKQDETELPSIDAIDLAEVTGGTHRPGHTSCSKCGMKLERREAERSRTGSQPRKEQEGGRKYPKCQRGRSSVGR